MKNRLIHRAHTLGISDLVTFRFKADRSEVAELLRESEILVLPSFKEGLPMILLEAMASANMIIASKLSPIIEVLGEAGLYFTPGEPSELESALLKALTDRELQRHKGQAAREIVMERFSWSVVLPMLEDLYHEVIT